MPIVVQSPSQGSLPEGPVTRPSTRERWIWIDAENEEFELTGFVNGVEVTKGVTGRGMPPLRIRRETAYGQPGEVTRDIQHGLREFTLPIVVLTEDFTSLHQTLHDIVRRMDPVPYAGTLRHIDRDGNTSDLVCRCTAGLQVANEGESGTRMHRAVLIFQADDPYWYGPTLTRPFSGSSGTSWFGPGWLPIKLGSSSVIGDVIINNDGDVETYPRWVIIGPAADPVVTNVTTGKTFVLEFDSPLSAGQAVVIDTRPFYKSVTGPAGQNWRRYLTQRQLWPLVKGVNQLSMTMGSTTEASYISISYQTRSLYP